MANTRLGLSTLEIGTDTPDEQGILWWDTASGTLKIQRSATGDTADFLVVGPTTIMEIQSFLAHTAASGASSSASVTSDSADLILAGQSYGVR